MGALATERSAGPVLLFDGECGLCNRVVRVLLRWDRAGRLRFAPLQGNAAQEYLKARGLPTRDFDSMVFVPDWGRRAEVGAGADPLFKTTGVIAALRVVDSGWTRMMAGMLALLPRGVRDAGYRVVARWRYRLFGAWRPRPLARVEWRERFLDEAEL